MAQKRKKIRSYVVTILLLTFGSLVYAAGIALFLDPNNLAPGGTTGIAIIIGHFAPLQTGTLVWIINVPILIFGWWKFGARFIFSTIYVTTIASVFMNLMNTYVVEPYGLISTDHLLCGVAGGALMALGMAMVFRRGATTGGTDVIVRALRQKYRHIKSGTIFIISDTMIITAAAIAFKNVEVALYAAITVFVSNMVLDRALYGGDRAKLLYIISAKEERISSRILEEIDIGITHLQAEGAYTARPTKVIMCVCSKYNYTKVRAIVREEDDAAFLIVSDASEVFGDGYKDHNMVEI